MKQIRKVFCFSLFVQAALVAASFLFMACDDNERSPDDIVDPGTTHTGWNEISTTVSSKLFCVNFVSETEGWVAGANGAMLRTTDQGDTWKTEGIGVTDEWLYDLDFVGNNVYACGSEATLLKGVNNGTDVIQWSSITIPDGGEDQFYRRVQFNNSQNGWVLETDWSYDNVRFLYTVGSMNWAVASGIPNTEDFSATDFQFTARQFPDPLNEGKKLNEGWLIGYLGDSPDGTAHLYHSVNGGRSWSLVLQDPDSWFHEIHFLDNDYGWITKTWGMLTTTNGGQSWESHDFKESLVAPHRMKFTDQNNGWTSMAAEGLYHTSDGGSSWSEQKSSDGTISFIEDIFMISSQIGFLVGDDGKIYKTTSGGK